MNQSVEATLMVRYARSIVRTFVGALALLTLALFTLAPGAAAVGGHAGRYRAHRPHHAVMAHVRTAAREIPGSLPAAPPSRPPHRHLAVVVLRHASGHRSGWKAAGRHSPTAASALAGMRFVSSRSVARDDRPEIRRGVCQILSGRGPPSPRLPRTNPRCFIEPHIPATHHQRLRFSSILPDVDQDPSQERSFTRSRAAFKEGTAACLISTLRGGVA